MSIAVSKRSTVFIRIDSIGNTFGSREDINPDGGDGHARGAVDAPSVILTTRGKGQDIAAGNDPDGPADPAYPGISGLSQRLLARNHELTARPSSLEGNQGRRHQQQHKSTLRVEQMPALSTNGRKCKHRSRIYMTMKRCLEHIYLSFPTHRKTSTLAQAHDHEVQSSTNMSTRARPRALKHEHECTRARARARAPENEREAGRQPLRAVSRILNMINPSDIF